MNSAGPLIVSQQLLKHDVLNRPSLIANVTSKVGSVDDNGSGKGYAYRASKAALNIINKMSIDLKEEFDCIACYSTRLGSNRHDRKNEANRNPGVRQRFNQGHGRQVRPLNGCWVMITKAI